MYPNEWKNGSTPRITSFSVMWNNSLTAPMFEDTLRLESFTPLGFPVEPEVKMIVSRSSGWMLLRSWMRSSFSGEQNLAW